MQLTPPRDTGPAPTDVATALRGAAQRLGHRPAVTLLLPGGRQEQSVASLAQWAAKGAHLLALDLLLEPGDRIHLDAPPSWGTAAVALAAWWAGIAVTLDPDAEVAVVHESRPAPDVAEVLRLGDGIDGAPLADTGDEAWVRAVQSFPDQPPAPAARPQAAALYAAGHPRTQQQLLAAVAAVGDPPEPGPQHGTLGLEVGEPATGSPLGARRDAGADLADVALRPLVLGRPTVILRGVGRAEATGEGVAIWR